MFEAYLKIHYSKIFTSVLLFWALPSAVALLATGFVIP